MTSAELYTLISSMMLEFLNSHGIYNETALTMYVYAACAFYPQADEWYIAHMGQRPNPIQCTV